jgi:fluoroquinolone transport system ATP-binding protein
MDDIGKNQAFIDLIKNKNIETIHSGETTLEDIFIMVTGVDLGHE